MCLLGSHECATNTFLEHYSLDATTLFKALAQLYTYWTGENVDKGMHHTVIGKYGTSNALCT